MLRRFGALACGQGDCIRYLAMLASRTLHIEPKMGSMQTSLLEKHFLRKHGRDAYYGQVPRSETTIEVV